MLNCITDPTPYICIGCISTLFSLLVQLGDTSAAQIVHLETKLKSVENEIMKLRSDRKKEMSQSRQKSQQAEESFQETAREQMEEWRNKAELLKVEVKKAWCLRFCH